MRSTIPAFDLRCNDPRTVENRIVSQLPGGETRNQ